MRNLLITLSSVTWCSYNEKYIKTCLKQPPKEDKKWFYRPINAYAGQKYCRMLQESILQYFRPSLSYQPCLSMYFGRLRQIYMDMHVIHGKLLSPVLTVPVKVPVHPGLKIRDEPWWTVSQSWRHRGQPWRSGKKRVKPAHVPGCFKMFKTTGTHWE